MISQKGHTQISAAFRGFFLETYDNLESSAITQVAWAQWQPILDRVCIVFKRDNPAFDRKKFLEGCGMDVRWWS